MNKLTRILTMGGLGLLATLAAGAGAAQAASPTASLEAKPAAGNLQWHNSDEVVGFYRSRLGCELAGQYGERAGDWDDHYCSVTRIGVRRGAWALRVSSDDDWNRGGFGIPFGAVGHFPGQFRPVWAGQWNHGGFGHGHGRNDHRGNRDHRGGNDNNRGGNDHRRG